MRAYLKFLILLIFLVSSATQAAPMPGTSTSALVKPELGIFHSKYGYEISAGGTGWLQSDTAIDQKFVEALYRSPKSATDNSTDKSTDKEGPATLTVRVDKMEKETTLDRYIQRWLKEYPKYGFDVLGSKSFMQNKAHGYVVDLVNRDQQKQLRQVVFMKKQVAIILTCRDQTKSFDVSRKNCNSIIRTFKWIE